MNPRVRVETELESVAIDLDLAIPVSLIFNEILTNAFKHAFPSTGVVGKKGRRHGLKVRSLRCASSMFAGQTPRSL